MISFVTEIKNSRIDSVLNVVGFLLAYIFKISEKNI